MITKINLLNFKCIDQFSAEFTDGIYLVTGENEIGKSSLLDAILLLLTGQRGSNLLQRGKQSGQASMEYIHTDGNTYEIEVIFTQANPRGMFTIGTKGSPLKTNNITALQQLFGYTDFDVNEFIKWSETADGRRKQLKLARQLLPVEILTQVETLETRISNGTQMKTTANIYRQQANATLKNTQRFTPEDVEKYKNPIDTVEVLDKVQKAKDSNRVIDDLEKDIKDGATDIAKKETEIKKLQKELDALNKTQVANEKKLKPLKRIDTTEMETQLSTAQVHNETHTKVALFNQVVDQVASSEQKHAEIEKALKQLTDQRAKLIKDNPLPIAGLEFTDDGLKFNRLPVEPGVLSTSQEMELAAMLVIALNPTTKVFRISQGESLGTKRLQALIDFALKNGYQGFIEQVVRGQEEMQIDQYIEILPADQANLPQDKPKAKRGAKS